MVEVEGAVGDEGGGGEAEEGGGGAEGRGAVLAGAEADEGLFGAFAVAEFGAFVDGALEDFGEVEGVAVGFLVDLFAAGEAVGEDEGIVGGVADFGEEEAFAALDGDIVVGAFFVSEGARHTAAAVLGFVEVGVEVLEEFLFVVHAHEGFVVAVAVEEDFLMECGGFEIGGVFGEELAEEEGLAGEALGVLGGGEEVGEFIAEDGGATGFEDDHGKSGLDVGAHDVHELVEPAFGGGDEAVVVEGASAAEVLHGDDDAEAGVFEDIDGGHEGFGHEVVVEGVGEEEDGGLGVVV